MEYLHRPFYNDCQNHLFHNLLSYILYIGYLVNKCRNFNEYSNKKKLEEKNGERKIFI